MVLDSPLLYLDFDGVLHDDEVYWSRTRGVYIKTGRLFERLPLLVGVLKPFPTVGVVLATTWVREFRFSRVVRYLRRAGAPQLADRIVGATYHSVHTPAWDYQTRYEQICGDASRRNAVRWLAIDNDAEGWPDVERHRLVHTPDSGMRWEDASALAASLSNLVAAGASSS